MSWAATALGMEAAAACSGPRQRPSWRDGGFNHGGAVGEGGYERARRSCGLVASGSVARAARQSRAESGERPPAVLDSSAMASSG